MATRFQHLISLDSALARAGFPPLTAWWREEFRRFYESGAATWIARVGRGGIKSTSLAKLALNEVLSGGFAVPPGERHFFAFVSVSRDEAAQRLRLLSAYLAALGIAHVPTTDTITLDQLPLGFRVFSSTIAGVSGFRCIGVAGDEVAKWRSADDAANPAAELATSLRAMTVTHPGARLAFFSSPLTSADWHSRQVERGDGDSQIVSAAASWIANPSVTEAQTRRLEPDDRIWRREYLAVPQSAALAAFDEPDVTRAFEPRSDIVRRFAPVLVIDFASGKKDTFSACFAGWAETSGGARVLLLDGVQGFAPEALREIGGEGAIAALCGEAKRRRVRVAFGDQRESLMVRGAFQRHGVRFVEMPWTSSSKPRGVARVRRWLAEGALALPPHDRLRDELLSFEEHVTPGGDFTFGARGSGHDDYVALLITAALADEERKLHGSPIAQRAPDRGGAGRPNPMSMRSQLRDLERVDPHIADRLELGGSSHERLVLGSGRERRRTAAGSALRGGGF